MGNEPNEFEFGREPETPAPARIPRPEVLDSSTTKFLDIQPSTIPEMIRWLAKHGPKNPKKPGPTKSALSSRHGKAAVSKLLWIVAAVLLGPAALILGVVLLAVSAAADLLKAVALLAEHRVEQIRGRKKKKSRSSTSTP